MIEQSGGRAGPNEFDFVNAGYKLDEIEPLRQQLLSQNDVGKVQKAIRKLGLRVKRGIIQAVKNYNFDSQGLGFTYENYAAWRRLATGKGTIGDAAYLVHEIAEVEELQRIQRETGFNFMGRNFNRLTRKQRKRWRSDFLAYFLSSHSKALEKEYEFVAEQVNLYIDDEPLKLSKLQAAAIDPTRRIKDSTGDTEAWRYMLVEGIAMKKHHHFYRWKARANEVIPISTSTQQRLSYYRPEITRQKLIILVKNMPIG
jgi:hypothetical protein